MGRKILVIGIGQTGCNAVNIFAHKMNGADMFIRSVAIDTDESVLEKCNVSLAVPLTYFEDMGSVARSLGEDNIKNWFPCDWQNDFTAFTKKLNMQCGSNLWRMKAMLALASFFSNDEKREALQSVLDEFTGDTEVYVVSSIAGGTGSGLLLPVTLYIKEYLRSIGCDIEFTTAMLAMPAVYENCYAEKQIIKSRANAYATLRELNAINITTVYGCNAEYGETHAPVKYTIGDNNGKTIYLFDSENEKYHSTQYKPFDKVVLFERIPGVMSAEIHVESIAEVLSSFCTDGCEEVNNTRDNLSLYGGVSLTKVTYPMDKVAEYISKRMLNDYIKEQLYPIHISASIEAANSAASVGAYVDAEDAIQARYRKKYIELLDNLLEGSDDDGLLLGKPAKLNIDYIKQVLNVDNMGDLQCAIDKSLLCDDERELESILSENRSLLEEKKNKKCKEKEVRTRQEIKEQFEQDVDRCRILIWNYYQALRKNIKIGNDAFIRSLTEEGNSLFSLKDKIFSDNGKYLHPTLALARLCQLANALEFRIKFIIGQGVPLTFEEDIPAYLLRIEQAENGRGKYFRKGKMRFDAFMSGDDPDIKRLINNADIFFEDVRTVYCKIKAAFMANRMNAALEALNTLISKYRALLDQLRASDRDMATELRLSLISSAGDNGHTVNVGAEVERKQWLYESFAKIHLDDEKALFDDDCALGKIISEFVINDTDDHIGIDELDSILGEMEGVFSTRLRTSDFYTNVLDKNIFCAMIEASNAHKDIEAVGASRFFMGRMIPLAYSEVNSVDERNQIVNHTLAILPTRVKEHIEENIALKKDETAEDFVRRLMYNAGEYHGQVCFSDRITEKELYIRKEITRLPLYTIDAVNENGRDCLCYDAYKTAMAAVELHMSQMWNADMVFSRTSQMKPFISTEKQAEYELSVAKALLMALFDNRISSYKTEDDREVYCMGYGAEQRVICYNDAPIYVGDFSSLSQWLYGELGLTEELSLQYDRMFEMSRKEFPAFDGNLLTYRFVATNIKRSNVFERFKLVLAEVILCLDTRDAFNTWFGANLMYAANKAFKDYCFNNTKAFDEAPIYIYNELICSFYEVLNTVCDQQTAERLLKFLNEKGFFNKYYLWENV